MAWIESHQEIARHPKLLRLVRLLKINKAQAIGHLHLLWWWTLDYSPTGEFSAFTSCELGTAAEWPGDGDQFVNALVESGWMDRDGDGLRLHQWAKYGGKYAIEKAGARERMRALRERSANIPERSANSSERSPGLRECSPLPTVPIGPTGPTNRGDAREPAPAGIVPVPSTPPPPPTFLPVDPKLFQRELRTLLETAKHELRRLPERPELTERRLAPEAADLVALLEREGNADRARAVTEDRLSWRTVLSDLGQRHQAAWKQRIAALDAALKGVVA